MTPRDLGNIHTTRNSCREILPCVTYFHVWTNESILYRFSQHMWPPLILQFYLKELFSCQLLSFLNIVKSHLLWPSFHVKYSLSWCFDGATCAMVEFIRHNFFSFRCKCWDAPVFDVIFWLNHVYSLLESKIQILLLKHLFIVLFR